MNKTHRFNVLLSPQQFAELQTLAQQKQRSMADLMRESVAALLDTELRHQPKCANGMQCIAGHLHPAALQNPNNPLAHFAYNQPQPMPTPRVAQPQGVPAHGTGTNG